MSVALGEPAFVVEDAPFLEGLVEFLDGVEVADPEELFLEGSDEALGDAVALGFADEGGAGPDTEKADFLLKCRLMYWEPWSCRRLRPRAASGAGPPKWRRTPWRTGSRASKRSARRAAWRPIASEAQWSTATNTVTGPSWTVWVAVASVPHMTSGISVVMVPS